jgi:hypothetical protein
LSKNNDAPLRPGTFDEASQFALMAERLQLAYPGDALARIGGGDIIEAYDQAGRLRYRSFNSFEYCNYSLDELSFHPWHELYSSPAETAEQLRAAREELIRGDAELITLEEKMPEYPIQEMRTPDHARFLVQERFAFRAVCGLNGEIYVVMIRKIRPA